MSSPKTLLSLEAFGINAVSLANNHAMDYCHKGLEATLGYLSSSNLSYAGAGLNLAEASAPTYIDCATGRVALIAATSSFHDSDAAGNQGYTVPGRPGINPLRHKAIYQLVPELYEKVLEIGAVTGMNDTLDWSAANGYRRQSTNAKLRTIEFALGDENKKISAPAENDMKRIRTSIHEAAIQANCVVVSIHSHQFKGNDTTPDDFIVKFCHNCIDEGANIIFGHGSHILRGIEIYNKGIIFYGLGDFILQNEAMNALPADFYEKYCSEEPELWSSVGLAMKNRSKNGTIGLTANPQAWQSMAVSISFEEGLREVKLYPLDLCSDTPMKGWPILTKNSTILERVALLSSNFGTDIHIKQNVGIVNLR